MNTTTRKGFLQSLIAAFCALPWIGKKSIASETNIGTLSFCDCTETISFDDIVTHVHLDKIMAHEAESISKSFVDTFGRALNNGGKIIGVGVNWIGLDKRTGCFQTVVSVEVK